MDSSVKDTESIPVFFEHLSQGEKIASLIFPETFFNSANIKHFLCQLYEGGYVLKITLIS